MPDDSAQPSPRKTRLSTEQLYNVSDTTQKRECLHVAARTFPFVARQRGKGKEEESWIRGGEVVPCVEGGGKTTFVFATTTAARI